MVHEITTCQNLLQVGREVNKKKGKKESGVELEAGVQDKWGGKRGERKG